MSDELDIVPENIFMGTGMFGILMIFVPFYLPLMFVITLFGASVIESLKCLTGARPQYSVLWGIATCVGLSYLTPVYMTYKLLEFSNTFDRKHLDFTGDICKQPSYYYPIALAPVFLLANIVLMWPLYKDFI
jgi:hypothetical protein